MTTKQALRESALLRRVAAVLFLLAVAPAMLFGVRTYGSFRLLRSAYEVGAPMTSSIRGWMTLKYVAAEFHLPTSTLAGELTLPTDIDPNTSLKTLANQAGIAPADYARRVQRAVAKLVPDVKSGQANGSTGWFAAISDQVLTSLLVYGYPALGLILLLGAIGLPLPDGVATTIAGSLASQGRIDWFWAMLVVVVASVTGDAIGYGLGRLLSRKFLDRHGRWFGLTTARRARAQSLFDRWGMLTVLITRTFLSYLSSIASLVAGFSRYRLPKFLATALAGRVVWTAAYFGLGYGIGSDWEAATSFLTNLSALILLLMLLVMAGVAASSKHIWT